MWIYETVKSVDKKPRIQWELLETREKGGNEKMETNITRSEQ